MKILPTDVDRCEWATFGPGRFQREFMETPRPVIVSGGIDHWPALDRWTPDFFRRKHGSQTVTIDGRDWRLDELIDRVEASTPEQPAPYLRNQLIPKWLPELLADISPMPECTRPNWLESRAIPAWEPLTYVELFIGGAGASFPVLHYDNLHTHAFLMQIYGEKEYLALAPDQGAFLYPQKGAASNKSSIDDLENPDPARFPLFDRAKAIRFRLRPGETLFVPAGWWHTARILSTSITVSVNGANRANWTALSNDFIVDRARGSRWRAEVLKPYMGALGVVFALRDMLNAKRRLAGAGPRSKSLPVT